MRLMVGPLVSTVLVAFSAAVAQPDSRSPGLAPGGPAGAPARAMTDVSETIDLVVVVANVRNGHGRVRIALWDRPEAFPKSRHAAAKASARAVPGAMRVVFPRLPAARYAAAVYHDENDDGELDRTWVGWPAEGLGFSNGAWIGLGPPDFEEAAVSLGPRQRTIGVTLRY